MSDIVCFLGNGIDMGLGLKFAQCDSSFNAE